MPYGYDVKKTDLNHAKIRDGLRNRGHLVEDTHDLGGGFPDLLDLTPWGSIELIEVKRPGKPLSQREIDWHRAWIARGGHVHIATTIEQIVDELTKEHERCLAKPNSEAGS